MFSFSSAFHKSTRDMEKLVEVTETQISVLAEKMLQRGKHKETVRRA